MNLVGQAAGYLGGRVPAQKPKQGGGGGPLGNLNPMQFTKSLPKPPGIPMGGSGGSPFPMGGAGGGAAAGGEAAGGAELAELAPLLLL